MARYHLTTKEGVITFEAKNEEAAQEAVFGLAITRQVSREEGPDASGGYTVIWRDGAQELKRIEFAAPYDPENAKAGEMITEKMIAAERALATSLGAPLCVRVAYGYQLTLPVGWKLEEAPALGEYEPDLAPAFKQFLVFAQADLKAAGRVSSAAAVASVMGFTAGAVNGAVNGNHSRSLDRLDRWCRIWNAQRLGPEIRIVSDESGVRLERGAAPRPPAPRTPNKLRLTVAEAELIKSMREEGDDDLALITERERQKVISARLDEARSGRVYTPPAGHTTSRHHPVSIQVPLADATRAGEVEELLRVAGVSVGGSYPLVKGGRGAESWWFIGEKRAAGVRRVGDRLHLLAVETHTETGMHYDSYRKALPTEALPTESDPDHHPYDF